MRIAFALLAGSVLVCAPLVGQQPRSDSGPHRMMGQGMMGHGGMMGHEMMTPMAEEMMGAAMRVMAFAPEHLLAHRDSLGLSPQQVARLTALRDAAQAAHGSAMTDAQHHLQAVEHQLDAVPLDTAALKVHFEAAHAAMGQAHWAMLSAAAQAKATLTDDQRAKVRAWADSMEAWTARHRAMMHPSPH